MLIKKFNGMMAVVRIISALLCIVMLVALFPVKAFAEDATQAKYTMWGNNILQSHIKENKYKKNPDGSPSYAIKPIDRYNKLCAALVHYSPDIIAFQECDVGWHDLIDDNGGYATSNGYKTFADIGYANVLDKNEYKVEGVNNPLYYKKDKFNVVKSGVVSYGDPTNNYYSNPWVFCYAILEDKSNGNRFAVSSTHISSSPKGDTKEKAAQIRELIAYMKNLETSQKVPLVMMGDYNCDPSFTIAYSEFKVGEKVFSARDVSKVVEGKNYVTHNSLTVPPEQTGSSGGGVIDHTMISTVGIAPEKYHVVVETFDKKNNISTYTYSDHVPQLFTFRVVGSDHKHTEDKIEKYDSDKHKIICSECFLSDLRPHDFGGKCDKNISDDAKKKTCLDCGEDIPYHNYKYISNGNAENSTHTAECVDCGRVSEKLAHSWTKKEIAPDYASGGYLLRTCDFCGDSAEESNGKEKLDIPKNAYDLGEGGQLTYYVGNPVKKVPRADGLVKSGEYDLNIEGLKPENDEKDNRFYLRLDNDKGCDIENVNIHLSYDAKNLYIAVEVTDNEFCANKYTDSLCFYIGTKGKTDTIDTFYMPRYTSGVVEAFPHNKKITTAAEAEREALRYVSAHKISEKENLITYEVAFKRSELSTQDIEKLFFGVIVRLGVGTRSHDVSLYFGFTTEGLENVFPPYNEGKSEEYLTHNEKNYYTHVVVLGEKPEIQETVTQETVTQGTGAENTSETTAGDENGANNSGKSGCSSTLHAPGIVMIGVSSLCAIAINKKKNKKKTY